MSENQESGPQEPTVTESPPTTRVPEFWSKLVKRFARGRDRSGVFFSTLERSLRNWLAERIRKIERHVIGFEDKVGFLPTTPEYRDEFHSSYVVTLRDALLGPYSSKIHNIALSGGYGVGKSSILREIADLFNGRVIVISLSSLDSPSQQKVPSQVEVPKEGQVDLKSTNPIQKEIVKQILYSVPPFKVPGSKYKRQNVRPFLQDLCDALFISLIVSLTGYLTGFTLKFIAPNLVKMALPKGLLFLAPWLPHLSVFAFLSLVCVLLFRRFRSYSVEKVSANAGPASVSLARTKDTYFDEYLDEIVYFFERTKRDIIIFEDIDRFNKPGIFEELKALNTILNGAAQLKRRNIRFIYALKDSIFEVSGEAPPDNLREDTSSTDAPGLSRTKFFDLVIPVVPFVSHRSARDLMSKALVELDHEISPDLVGLVAKYVPDMRLIKNIVNEFLAFRKKILEGSGKDLELSDEGLFAMMVYKNTQLKEFEKISAGSSELDDLYRDSREFVRNGLAALSEQEQATQKHLTELDSVAERASMLEEAVKRILSRTEKFFPNLAGRRAAITLDGEQLTLQQLTGTSFWRKFLASTNPILVQLPGLNETMQITRESLADELGESLSEGQWEDEDRKSLDAKLQRIRADRTFLAKARIEELMREDQFMASVKTAPASSFAEIAKDRISSPLVYALVEKGYIDQNFTLYTSIYYGDHVSAAAMNFLIHNVDPLEPDYFFDLQSVDVDAILREREMGIFGQRGTYNIALVNHLLARRGEALDKTLSALARFGEDEAKFIDAYFRNSPNLDIFVGAICSLWAGIFTFLTQDKAVTETDRINLVDVALSKMSEEINYSMDSQTVEFIRTNAEKLSALTAANIGPERANRIMSIFSEAGLFFEKLAPLSGDMKASAINHSSYDLTPENIKVGLGTQNVPSLDHVLHENPSIYRYLTRNCQTYLAMISEQDDKIASIESNTDFIEVLEDVLKYSASTVPDVVRQSAPECMIESLNEIDSLCWPYLAENLRFPSTFSNVNQYLEEIGFDEDIAKVLEASKEIKDLEQVTEEQKQELAITLIESGNWIPSPESRIELAASLELESYVPAEKIPSEAGILIGGLIEESVIADKPASFARIPKSDWIGQEFAMSKSKKLVEYISSAELPEANVQKFFESLIVPSDVKDIVLKRLGEFTPSSGSDALSAAGRYAIAKGTVMQLEAIERFASAKIDPLIVIDLLSPILTGVPVDALVSILSILGGDWAKLSTMNGTHPKIPQKASTLRLVSELEKHGLANSSKSDGIHIKVNMKQGR